jgi:hypothetical protein
MHPHPTLIKSYFKKDIMKIEKCSYTLHCFSKLQRAYKIHDHNFFIKLDFYSAYLFISRCNESWLTIMGSISPQNIGFLKIDSVRNWQIFNFKTKHKRDLPYRYRLKSVTKHRSFTKLIIPLFHRKF